MGAERESSQAFRWSGEKDSDGEAFFGLVGGSRSEEAITSAYKPLGRR
jgi:hypothetical protein